MMQGGELFDRIRKKISFTENEASDITRQVSTCSFWFINATTKMQIFTENEIPQASTLRVLIHLITNKVST